MAVRIFNKEVRVEGWVSPFNQLLQGGNGIAASLFLIIMERSALHLSPHAVGDVGRLSACPLERRDEQLER